MAMLSYDGRVHASDRHEIHVGDRDPIEWTDAAGFPVLLQFTLEIEHSDGWDGPDHTIDPLLAEVWPCIARPRGHAVYAEEALSRRRARCVAQGASRRAGRAGTGRQPGEARSARRSTGGTPLTHNTRREHP